jgi:hypothetical protein
MNADKYDFNVWSREANKLCISAHEWEYSPDGYLQTNSNKYHTIEFTAPQDTYAIEVILGDLYVNQYPLTDYDEWIDYKDIYLPRSPKALRDFIENLPDYPIILDRQKESV